MVYWAIHIELQLSRAVRVASCFASDRPHKKHKSLRSQVSERELAGVQFYLQPGGHRLEQTDQNTYLAGASFDDMDMHVRRQLLLPLHLITTHSICFCRLGGDK